jgi:muramoyltetrapeptide carboxypeptidase
MPPFLHFGAGLPSLPAVKRRTRPASMKFPPDLKPGDLVVIVSPAGRIDGQVLENGAECLRRRGYEVRIGRHAFESRGMFAGSDAQRAADMQEALDDPEVKAVFFSRGGYGSLRTHLRLDWSAFFENPKWLVGFSDITVFHSFLARHGIASVHGVMTSMFGKHEKPSDSLARTIALLEGDRSGHELASHELNRKGGASGILTGGNLSVIQSLRGTPLDLEPEGKILFIEDINEQLYHIDRMMRNLLAGGVLEQISGLVVGHFTDMKDGTSPYGQTVCEIIREVVEPYDYPVVFGFPAGHELPNMPLLMGGEITVEVDKSSARIAFRS